MNTKSKKIFKRVGAGLMLGLSLLGFGVNARGGQTSQLPRKIRNLRQKEKKQLNTESQELLTMIENEARTAITEEQTEQQQDLQQKRQQDSLNKLSFGQKVFRYSILGVWGISAGVFFSSLIFNTPVTLGKKVLSVLPGMPHMAILKIELAEESKNNDKMIINLSLDSSDYPVMFVKAILKYDPQKIDFSGYRIISGEYKEMKVSESNDKKEEELELIFQLEKEKTFNNERLVQLDFDTIQGGEIAKIDFIQAESLVIVKGEEDEHNILGKTTGVKFLTKHPKVKTAVDCYAFEDKNPVDIVAWQEVVGSYSSSSEKNYWQDIDDENSFICGSGNGSIYFLLARLGEENLKVIEKATLNIQKHGENGINKLSSEKVFGWEENDVDFSVFEFKPVVEISDAENFFIEFFGSQYAVRWPTAEGFGRMEFGN